MKKIALMMILLLIMISSANALPLNFNDLSKLFYQSQSSEEYWKFESLTYRNDTTVANESITASTNTSASLVFSDVNSGVVILYNDGSAFGSGNYSVNYTAGSVLVDQYFEFDVTNETNILLDNTTADNVTYNSFGIVSGSITLFNTTSGSVVPSGDYSVTASTGTILLTNDSSPYNGVNVSANYTYYNDTADINVSYTWNNKLSINCTPPDESNVQRSFVKEIKFVLLETLQRVQLWKGTNVVTSDGTAISSNNIMGGYWYVNNQTQRDTIDFGYPFWDRNNLFSLKVLDGVSNGTTVRANIICGFE